MSTPTNRLDQLQSFTSTSIQSTPIKAQSKYTNKNKNKNQIKQKPIKIQQQPIIIDLDNQYNHQTPTFTPPPLYPRHWRNIGGNILQILSNPPQVPVWNPIVKLPIETNTTHPFGQRLQQHYLPLITHYCQGNSVIIQSFRKPNIHITTKDLRDIISPNTPIYHENLILSLELLCSHHEGAYLDPSFYPTLRDRGWTDLKRRFASSDQQFKIDKPSFKHPIIAIPIHIKGNHWTTLCRRIINGVTYFYYADNLNNARIENTIKHQIFHNTDSTFCPTKSQWITCATPNFTPHQNECGPHTILALAVLMSHPAPHPAILHPYISPNLVQYCRTWMSLLLTSGMAPLLLYTSVDLSTDLHSNRILATPFTMLQWDYITNDHLNHSTKGKISPNLSRTPIKSPKNQFL